MNITSKTSTSPKSWVLTLLLSMVSLFCLAEDTSRQLPKEWKNLVKGSQFIERFLPLPVTGKLTSNTWGRDAVKPRYIENGIEDQEWSYWGGNIYEDEQGRFHLFVCRWLEDNPKGHMAWPKSEIVHGISDNSIGPYRVINTVGQGHNPEIQQLRDGSFFLYSYEHGSFHYYYAKDLNGDWQRRVFDFDSRQREIVDHMANGSFAKRDDGSMLMVGRGGGIWVSETGLPPYKLVSTESVYPKFDGRYEDPVIWRTNIQYHLIVNDWLGRIAYYMRSKDGFHWKLDPGVAYQPGIARHKDGRVEDWYKFERIKVLQDQHGRAYQANFAVNDTAKKQDLGKDIHSSKNISIPLRVGRLVELITDKTSAAKGDALTLLIRAEAGFDPIAEIDIQSLRFGASQEVNYGRGGRVIASRKLGKDLELTFATTQNDFNEDDFAGKLLGSTKREEPLFGFTRLSWIEYELPFLSSKLPEFSVNAKKLIARVEVENFGQVSSVDSTISIEYYKDKNWHVFDRAVVPALAPYTKTHIMFAGNKIKGRNEVVKVRVVIDQAEQDTSTFEGLVIIR